MEKKMTNKTEEIVLSPFNKFMLNGEEIADITHVAIAPASDMHSTTLRILPLEKENLRESHWNEIREWSSANNRVRLVEKTGKLGAFAKFAVVFCPDDVFDAKSSDMEYGGYLDDDALKSTVH